VRAALTILRAYIVAGKPEQKRKPLGSYEEWSQAGEMLLVRLTEAERAQIYSATARECYGI